MLYACDTPVMFVSICFAWVVSDVCVSFASLGVCDWCVVYMCSMIGEACFNNLPFLIVCNSNLDRFSQIFTKVHVFDRNWSSVFFLNLSPKGRNITIFCKRSWTMVITSVNSQDLWRKFSKVCGLIALSIIIVRARFTCYGFLECMQCIRISYHESSVGPFYSYYGLKKYLRYWFFWGLFRPQTLTDLP